MCSSSTVIFLSNSFGVHVHLIHVRSVSSVVHTIFSSELKQVFPRNRHTHTFNIVPYAAAFPHMNEHCRRWMQRSQLDECYFALWLNSNIFNKFIRFLLSFVLSLFFFGIWIERPFSSCFRPLSLFWYFPSVKKMPSVRFLNWMTFSFHFFYDETGCFLPVSHILESETGSQQQEMLCIARK